MTQPYAPQPWTPPAPRPRRRAASIIIVSAVGLLIVSAIGLLVVTAVAVYSRETSGTVKITGSLFLSSDHIQGGRTCQGADGYDDIRGGASVVIHDPGGRTIATGRIDEGVAMRSSDPVPNCRFAFTVTGVPHERFYGIEVSHRGTVTFSAEQVAAGEVRLLLEDSDSGR